MFAQKLFYENGATPQYNGNISSMIWNTQRKNHSRYNFRYDALNRLTKAKYTPKGNYNTEYSYDLNGNITHLKRKAMVQSIKHPDGLKKRTIDNLKYQYSGNQLFSVRDKLTEVCENYGFLNNGSSVKGQNTGGNYTNDREYYYDANGNLIKDRNKGIEGIEYNLLNLPKRILYKQNNAIYYTYDASGVKWAKEIHKDGGIKRFDYLGNFVYEDHVLKYIITDYGKIVISKVNNPFIRYYDLRDHLGNVRASFRANENNTLTLLQEDSYYPFGMQHPSMSYLSRDTEHKNLHLYNGKELQEDFDLNWYDYGARFYDVELVRWHVVDAHAENYFNWSPYNYVGANPIKRIDINGMDWDIVINHNKKTITIQTNFNTYSGNQSKVQAAANAWNAQSGKFNYVMRNGKATICYSVNFEVTVNTSTKGANNTISVIPDNSKIFQERKEINSMGEEVISKIQGVSNGEDIWIKYSQKDNANIIAHEMGHNMGIGHSYGLMRIFAGGKYLTKKSVKEVLGHSGIGTGVKGATTNANLKNKTEKGKMPIYFQTGKLKKNNDWEKTKFYK